LYQEYFNYNFEDNLYSSDNSDWIKETSNKYCIYWYRYNLNYINEQDKEIAGVGWERILVDKDNKTIKNLGIPLEEGINGYNQK
jgi:hypothetical protein